MKRIDQRGLSLTEVLVASSLFLVVMMIGAGAMQVVKRAGDHLQGRSLPRQQLRALLGHLQRDVRAATFVYDPHLTVSFGGGFQHEFDGGPSSDPAQAAKQEVIFAIAESAASEPPFRLMSLFLQPDGANQKAYPGAHRVVMATVSHQTGPTPGSPADIPLNHLSGPQTDVRTFATASPADGLAIRRSVSGDGLDFTFVVGHQTEGESVVFETYQTRLTMRNNR